MVRVVLCYAVMEKIDMKFILYYEDRRQPSRIIDAESLDEAYDIVEQNRAEYGYPVGFEEYNPRVTVSLTHADARVIIEALGALEDHIYTFQSFAIAEDEIENVRRIKNMFEKIVPE